jgi:membrane protein implicated in regulation of membrane protease activity
MAIVALSVVLRLVSDRAVMQLFVAASVFGGGVVALDFLGILGGHHGDGGHDDIGDMAAHVPDAGVHDSGGHEAGDGHLDHAHDAGHDDSAGHHEAATHTAGHGGAVMVLSVLTFLRTVVYFSLGFGPAGWAGMAAGWGPLRSLALAVPFGIVALALALAFFRFQGRDTGAYSGPADLSQELATVIVPLDDKTMGKVRVKAGMNVSDLYALSAEPGLAFQKGERVRIIRVRRDCVLVR